MVIFSVLTVTRIWYSKKEKLNCGPFFPIVFHNTLPDNFHILTLNRTHVMILNMPSKKGEMNLFVKVAIMNFKTQKWFHVTDLKMQYSIDSCKGAIASEKNGHKYVIFKHKFSDR